MPARNSTSDFGSVARWLHWITALLIVVLLGIGGYMHDLPQGTDAEVAHKAWFFSLHKTLGMLAFGLALLRLFWALSNAKPHPLAAVKPKQVMAAEITHWMLYLGILLTPLAGYLHHLSTAGGAAIWLPLPETLPFIPQTVAVSQLSGILHFLCVILMVTSIALHVAGAIYHGLVLRDDTLKRMIPLLKSRGSEIGEAEARAKPAFAALAIFGLFLGVGTFALNDPQTFSPMMEQETGIKANWEVNKEKSLVEIQTLQMGDVVLGTFADWTASIAFYPKHLEASQIEATINLNSLELGMVTAQALGPEFFDTETFSTATWRSTEISELEPGRYLAQGALALSGLEVPVPLEFTLAINDGEAIAEAIAEVDRNSFGIGMVAYPTEESLGYMIRVRIVIEATATGR